jgi:hypothetical protein
MAVAVIADIAASAKIKEGRCTKGLTSGEAVIFKFFSLLLR